MKSYRIMASPLVLGLSVLTCILLSGCVSLNKPTSRSKIMIANGELKAVLMQVNAKWIDWDSVLSDGDPSISGHLSGKEIANTFEFLTGSFETGGYLSNQIVYFLSEDLMMDGWILLLVKGNSQYLDIVQKGQGPITLEDLLGDGWISNKEANERAYYQYKPKWRIQSEEGENLVYVGKLDLTVHKLDLGIFGRSYVHLSQSLFTEEDLSELPPETSPEIVSKLRAFQRYAETKLSRGNDQFALSLLRAHFPGSDDPVVRLMEKHESGPLLFNEPVH